MAPHSSTLAWKIPWTEEPDRLQSMGSWRVGHDWATSLSLFTFMHWRRKWQPTPVFLPGESQGRRNLVASTYGVAQSWTQVKQLSSSSRVTFTYIQWRKGLHRDINTRNQESLRTTLEMGYHFGEALWKVFTGQDYLYSIWVNLSHI